MVTPSPSPSWGEDASSGGPCVARWWSVSCSRASSSGLTLGLSRAQRCDSAHHMRSRLSTQRWSTDALTAVKTASSKMWSLIAFPHFGRRSGAGTSCRCPAGGPAMATRSAEGFRLRAALSLAQSDLWTKHRYPTGGPWVCVVGLERAHGVSAASCLRPRACARHSRPPGATPQFVPGVPSTLSSELSPSSSLLTLTMSGLCMLHARGIKGPSVLSGLASGQSWS